MPVVVIAMAGAALLLLVRDRYASHRFCCSLPLAQGECNFCHFCALQMAHPRVEIFMICSAHLFMTPVMCVFAVLSRPFFVAPFFSLSLHFFVVVPDYSRGICGGLACRFRDRASTRQPRVEDAAATGSGGLDGRSGRSSGRRPQRDGMAPLCNQVWDQHVHVMHVWSCLSP